MDGIFVKDNTFIEYDCVLTASAAMVCGHGLATDNVLGPNIIFENNTYDPGRKVFCYRKTVADQIIYDDAAGDRNHVIGAIEMN